MTGLESHDIWDVGFCHVGASFLFIICLFPFTAVLFPFSNSLMVFWFLLTFPRYISSSLILIMACLVLSKLLWAGFMVFLCWVWSCLWLSSLIRHLVPPLSHSFPPSPQLETPHGVFFTVAIISKMECLPTPPPCVSPTFVMPSHQSHPHASHETLNELWKTLQNLTLSQKIIELPLFYFYIHISHVLHV